VLEGHASNDETLICWGTAHMTLTGDRLGVAPSGRCAEVPVFIRFTFEDDLIASERFFFDLSTLCAQSGVSTDAVRRVLFNDAADPHSQPVMADAGPTSGRGAHVPAVAGSEGHRI
jgi:hypothetical protein